MVQLLFVTFLLVSVFIPTPFSTDQPQHPRAETPFLQPFYFLPGELGGVAPDAFPNLLIGLSVRSSPILYPDHLSVPTSSACLAYFLSVILGATLTTGSREEVIFRGGRPRWRRCVAGSTARNVYRLKSEEEKTTTHLGWLKTLVNLENDEI